MSATWSIAAQHLQLRLAESVANRTWEQLDRLALTDSSLARVTAVAIGAARMVRGDASGALPFLEHAVQLAHAAHGRGHDHHLSAVGFCAQVLEDLGRFTEALLLLEETVAEGQRANPASPLLTHLELRLGDGYCARRLFDRARPLLEQALTRHSQSDTKRPRDRVESLLRVASRLDLPTGDTVSAQRRLDEARALIDAGRDASWTHLVHFNLSMLSGRIADCEGGASDAIAHFAAAYDAAASFADSSGLRVDAAIAIADVLTRIGRDREAVDRLNALVSDVGLPSIRAWPIQFARFLNLFSGAAFRTGVDAPYAVLIAQAARALVDAVRDEWPAATEQRRLELTEHGWRQVRAYLAFVPAFVAPLDEAALADIYELVIVLKGAVGHSMRIATEQQLASRYPECRSELERLGWIRRRLQGSYADVFQGLPDSGPETAAQDLRLEKTALEQALRARIPELAPLPAMSTTLLAVKLPVGSVLLDFVKTDGAAAGHGDSLTVFVMPAFKRRRLATIALQGLAEIRSAVRRLRDDIIRHGEGLIAAPDYGRVWTLVWEPIERALAALRESDIECSTLIVSADDELATLPFAVLRDPQWHESQFLLDRYEIRYLTHASQLGIDDRPAPGSPALAIGLNRFDAAHQTDGGSVTDTVFPALAHAEDEARDVARRFDGDAWTGDLVSKDAILERLAHIDQPRRASGYRSPWLLHIATHGLVVPSGCLDEPDQSSPARAMKRALLALRGAAGSSRELELGSVPDDHPSLITAFDVACLDLRHTALTVLSACDAGLGRIATGEGVFSLQRAFMQAGSRSVVMPLWSVHDDPMRLLMAEFYDGVAAGRHSAAALRAAQQKVRDAYPWPVAWGGVVAVGRSCGVRLQATPRGAVEIFEPL